MMIEFVDAPALLNAAIRAFTGRFGVNPVTDNEVEFAGAVPYRPLVEFRILNPSSSLELSIQLNVIESAAIVATVKIVGVFGKVKEAVIVDTGPLNALLLPPIPKAVTLKK